MSAVPPTNMTQRSDGIDRVEDLLGTSNVRCGAVAASRKRVLQLIAELVADEELNADAIFDGLMARERLGSTGLGEGVAIPHCRMACKQIRAAFVSLPEPIDYEASDGLPVDLLFVLVVPHDEQRAHLEALAALAEVFSDPGNRADLRGAHNNVELLQIIYARLANQVPDSRTA